MRNIIYILILLLAPTALSSSTLHAQTLTRADSLLLSNLRKELPLPERTLNAIDSLYQIPLTRLQQIDKEINRISRTNTPQSEKDQLFSVLRAEKKALKEERELSILLLLTAEEQHIYKTKVIPNKPDVLHMGSNHDRASCNVCIKPQ